MESIKKQLLSAINSVVPLNDYEQEDFIFSLNYHISPVAMVYILQRLTADFHFTINDDFVDALEMCTFGRLEELLEQYSGTAPASEVAGQASSDAE